MDSRFLEFWGNFLLSAAKGQEQAENLNRLVREGVKAFEQQMSLFEKFYGLDRKADSPDQYAQMWSKAASDFAKSYHEFMGLMGTVSREDHEALRRENEELTRKVAALEEALKREKKEAGSRETDPADVVKGFEGLMKKQAEQFQALMESYGKMYEVKKPGRERRTTHTTDASNKRG